MKSKAEKEPEGGREKRHLKEVGKDSKESTFIAVKMIEYQKGANYCSQNDCLSKGTGCQ